MVGPLFEIDNSLTAIAGKIAGGLAEFGLHANDCYLSGLTFFSSGLSEIFMAKTVSLIHKSLILFVMCRSF